MYVFDKNFLRQEKEVKWWKSQTLQEEPKNLKLFKKDKVHTFYHFEPVQKRVVCR